MDILQGNSERYSLEQLPPEVAGPVLERVIQMLVLSGFAGVLVLESWLLIRMLIS